MAESAPDARASALRGAFVAATALLALEGVGFALGRVPDATVALALIVAVTAFITGPIGGMAGAGVCIVVALVEPYLGGPVFPTPQRFFVRLGVMLVSLPFLGLLVGLLRQQAQNRLAREREARAEAEAAERRYRRLVEGLGAVIWQADAVSNRVDFVSRRAAELFGWPVADWLDSDAIWARLIHPDDYDRVMALRREAAHTGRPFEIEYRAVCSDGTIRRVRSLVQPDPAAEGQPGTLRGVIVDITELREAEARLREEQERYRSVIEHAGDILLVHDAEGRIVDANRVACDALGLPRDTLLASSIADIEVDFDAEASCAVWRGLEPGRPTAVDRVYRRADGSTFPVEVRLGTLQGSGPSQVVTLARDLSERNRIEEQLRRAQKLEAVGRLAGGIAHDFNNLLTTIRGHAELLLRDAGPTAGVRADLEEITKAAGRAAVLTHQLLAFSRRQVVSPEVLDANAVVGGLEPVLVRLLGPRIELRTALEPVPSVRADRSQIEQALVNLVENARDAMPDGGRLTITTREHRIAAADPDRDPVLPPGRYVALRVADTGHGMDAATQARVYEPFFTTRARGAGGGLGLSTAYGIVRQAGGHLTVESTPGRGATFTMLLPASSQAPATRAQPIAPEPVAAGGTETILVVEDEDAVRSLVTRILRKKGYTVLEAGDGAEALDVHRSGAHFDLLLSDIVMPRINGRELALRLRAERPDLRLILMSGYTDDSIAQGRELPPDTAFLAKPFTPEELAAAVRRVLGRPAAGPVSA
jgi:two-component system cell cycle sensor histidine kinase/response regulator CckA